MEFIHEYDADGNHRLTTQYNLETGRRDPDIGDWTTYPSLALVNVGGTVYFVATTFWDGTFVPDMVYMRQQWTRARLKAPGPVAWLTG